MKKPPCPKQAFRVPAPARIGLCCIFCEVPLKFRTTTAAQLLRYPREAQLERICALVSHNVAQLRPALQWCAENRVGAFRILSPLFPRVTHPEVGYRLEDLAVCGDILDHFREINEFRTQHDLRLSFHPDQFVVLSSPREEVVQKSLQEIEYQVGVGRHLGAEVINIHLGGAYGDKAAAMARFAENFGRLSESARRMLTLENDDVSYTPRDLLPLCHRLQIPLVYDVHHHRCNPDGLSEEEATRLAIETWDHLRREPYFHLSSPRAGWGGGDPRPHADYIDPRDWPDAWSSLSVPFTVDLEAKAKELAVLKFLAG